MKLWSGFFTWRVEWLFGIDETTGSRIFVSWVNFIYPCLSAIPIWPTREQVDQTTPQTFKDSYPSIHVNIDYSEFYCEAPTSLELKGNMCIQTITVTRPIRPLWELLPNASVSFVSHLYYGSLSDRQILERSGLLNPNMFDDGDETVAHKGFIIRDLTDKLPCQFFLDPGINLKLTKLLLTRK